MVRKGRKQTGVAKEIFKSRRLVADICESEKERGLFEEMEAGNEMVMW